MININPTLLDLAHIINTIEHGEVWSIMSTLKEAKLELEMVRYLSIGEHTITNEMLEDITSIDQQIWFIDQNINTLESALEMYENEISEKFRVHGKSETFWLN